MSGDSVERLDVVFCGDVVPGADVATVKEALAKRFKLNGKKLDKLFDGQVHVVKKALSSEKAARYAAEFKKAGALTELRPAAGNTPITSRSQASQPEPLSLSSESVISDGTPDARTVQPPANATYPRHWLIVAALGGVLLGAGLWSFASSEGENLSDREAAQIRLLQNELRQTRSEIASAEKRRSRYDTGSMLMLIDARTELLKTTAALLQQRIHAVASRSPLVSTAPVALPEPSAANQLFEEIEGQKVALAKARAEAEHASGLVAASRQLTLALEEQTLAALRMKYLTARFGLPAFDVSLPNTPVIEPLFKPLFKPLIADQPVANPSAAASEALSPGSYHGPFGLKMGLSARALGARVLPGQPGAFVLPSVPVPYKGFDTYVARIGRSSGLCWLKAVGKDVQTNQHGIALKQAFADMQEKLSKTYGDYEHTDTLVADSIWSQPRDWMMGLSKNDRYLVSIWEPDQQSRMESGLQSIALSASAKTKTNGYISVEYHFQNHDACTAEISTYADSML